jgi:hypothetical protein
MLYAARVESARQRGIPYIAVDASSMSQPILERYGFTKLCTTTPFTIEPGKNPQTCVAVRCG